MLEQYFHCRRVLDRLGRNLLGTELAVLAEHLARREHSVTVIQSYIQAAEHFGHWLARTRHTANDVNAALVVEFLRQHLRCCRCQLPRSRTVTTLRAALAQLVFVMEARRAPATSPTPIDSVATAFDSYLEAICGLAASTRLAYGRYLREFLASTHGVPLRSITSRRFSAIWAWRH